VWSGEYVREYSKGAKCAEVVKAVAALRSSRHRDMSVRYGRSGAVAAFNLYLEVSVNSQGAGGRSVGRLGGAGWVGERDGGREGGISGDSGS
jgi:hypothetical protein